MDTYLDVDQALQSINLELSEKIRQLLKGRGMAQAMDLIEKYGKLYYTNLLIQQKPNDAAAVRGFITALKLMTEGDQHV